jgi:zinc protease
VTNDEFNRAREPLLSYSRGAFRDNGYWLNVILARAQEKPEHLEWARTRVPDIEGIKPSEINALAAKYLGRARASRATILPATKNPVGPSASK